jgi:hypothetical protein
MAGINDQVDKIDVNGDSRVSRNTAVINGKTYGIVAWVSICAHDAQLTVVCRVPGRRT